MPFWIAIEIRWKKVMKIEIENIIWCFIREDFLECCILNKVSESLHATKMPIGDSNKSCMQSHLHIFPVQVFGCFFL